MPSPEPINISTTLTHRRRRALSITAGLVLFYTITGFLILPPIVRNQAVEKLSAALKRPVAIEKIAINPFALSVTVRGFTVTDHDGSELAGFDEFHANFQLSSLFRRMWFFHEVRLEHPRGRIVAASDGSLNIADLAPEATEPAPPAAAPPRFLVETLAISSGGLDFNDHSRANPFKTTVGPVSVAIHNFGTGAGRGGEITLSGDTESGERFAFAGSLDLNTPGLAGRLTVTGINAPKYDPFHRSMTLFEVSRGKISFDLQFEVDMRAGLSWRVNPASVSIEDLHVRARGEDRDALYIPALQILDIHADSATRTATVGRVALEPYTTESAPAWAWHAVNPDATAPGVAIVNITRLRDGSIDLATLLTPRIEDTEPPGSAPAPAQPWSVSIAEAAIIDAAIDFTDLTNERPAHLVIDRLTATAHNFSTDRAAEIPFEGKLRWQEKGTVSVKGRMRQEPLHARVELTAADLALAALDPYLGPWADVRVSDGTVRAAGTLTVSRETPDAEPALSFEGAAGLDNLAVNTAAGDRPFTSLGSIDLRDIRFQSPPVRLDIAEVAVKSPSVAAAIAKDGSIDLMSALKQGDANAVVEQPPQAAVPTSADAARPQITIGRVIIEDGRADVADRSLPTEFKTSVRDFGGTIAGLSSEELARADVDLKGTLDGKAPFHLSGTINPLSENAFTDLKVEFHDIALPAFTPYSGRFIGYTIDRGRLSLDLTYRLSSRVLEAENGVILDNFFLGDTVESPDATRLPYKLALGLLRDRSGKIDIDLPIRGNLDDPDFRYGKIVWKAIGALIAKAATAPFSLLGKLIPGGHPEDLNHVKFAPGSAQLAASETDKLATLADALYERPALILEVASAPAPDFDEPVLRAKQLAAQLVARKLGNLAAAGLAAADPASITLDTGAREALLREEFAAAFPAEADAGLMAAEGVQKSDADGSVERPGVIVRTFRKIFGGGQKPSPAAAPAVVPGAAASAGPTPEEMETRLLERIEITPNQLETLAAARSAAVRDELLASGKVAPERVVLATVPAEPKDPSKAAGPRVDFSLK